MEQDRWERLMEQGFTQDQLAEIEEGEKAGLDTSVYARKEYLAIQMRQIRLGLARGLTSQPMQNRFMTGFRWKKSEED